jgi:acyl-CoA synthetase (NDP forming)
LVNKETIFQDVSRRGGTILTEIESKEILKEAGISVVEAKLAKSKGEAIALGRKIGFPVALKIASPDVVHKSDAGGVRVALKSGREVGRAYDEILASVKEKNPTAHIQGVSVQSMARPGVEIIIGMSKDPQFGPVIMFGLGGILVEILKDVSFRITPLTRRDASEMIREIKGYPLLQGYRGQEPVGIPFLEDLILKVSDFVEQNHEVKELDLNPIFGYADGAIVVDARMALEDEAPI